MGNSARTSDPWVGALKTLVHLGFWCVFNKQGTVFQTVLKPPVESLFVTPDQRAVKSSPQKHKEISTGQCTER